jgi:hypothetical protein
MPKKSLYLNPVGVVQRLRSIASFWNYRIRKKPNHFAIWLIGHIDLKAFGGRKDEFHFRFEDALNKLKKKGKINNVH